MINKGDCVFSKKAEAYGIVYNLTSAWMSWEPRQADVVWLIDGEGVSKGVCTENWPLSDLKAVDLRKLIIWPPGYIRFDHKERPKATTRRVIRGWQCNNDIGERNRSVPSGSPCPEWMCGEYNPDSVKFCAKCGMERHVGCTTGTYTEEINDRINDLLKPYRIIANDCPAGIISMDAFNYFRNCSYCCIRGSCKDNVPQNDLSNCISSTKDR